MALTLSFACPAYDRILPLSNGRVTAQGIRLNHLPMEVEEVFWRQLRNREFDISESSLSSYVMLRSRGDERFIAIPVFTSRVFRHAFMFKNVHKGIRSPQDLKGKIVGLPEYQITAVVWLRGILQDEYGVAPEEIHWRSGGQETPGRKEKITLDLPAEIDLQLISPDKTISKMLDDGELDAMIGARTPSCFSNGSPNVARILEDPYQTEKEYFKKTGIFPIMHTVIIRRDVYERNPWIAVNLYRAFCDAKEMAIQSYGETAALYVTLPWIGREYRRTTKIFGEDYWPYGVAANRHVLETFLRYHHEQGLSKRLMTIEELFAPETLDEEFVI